MVKKPNTLDPMVREHLTILTDERDTCRRYSPDGTRCLQDDYVFSLAEQRNQHIERDDRVIKSAIAAGHIEVLGVHSEPRKLLHVLERNGLLRSARLEDGGSRRGRTGETSQRAGWVRSDRYCLRGP
jgi:hypothetical protein